MLNVIFILGSHKVVDGALTIGAFVQSVFPSVFNFRRPKTRVILLLTQGQNNILSHTIDARSGN